MSNAANTSTDAGGYDHLDTSFQFNSSQFNEDAGGAATKIGAFFSKAKDGFTNLFKEEQKEDQDDTGMKRSVSIHDELNTFED